MKHVILALVLLFANTASANYSLDIKEKQNNNLEAYSKWNEVLENFDDCTSCDKISSQITATKMKDKMIQVNDLVNDLVNKIQYI